jgi:hypothetical protein
MRITVGTLGALGIAVAVATGQPPRERAAQLKPPIALPTGATEPVARGAEPSLSFGGTPVEKRPAAPVTGPAWLTGADPNLQPAGGAAPKTAGAKVLTPATPDGTQTEPSFRERVKNALPTFGTKDAPPPPNPLPDQLTKKPAPKPPADPIQPTAATAFKAVSGTGAPVYAGPPAYRWYGWGTVTPGANPIAPAGQYPKASAAWYSVTGATPGAFPVPVTGGGQPLPGVEPPTYGLARSAPTAPVAPPSPGAVSGSLVPPPARPQPQPEPKFQPTPSAFAPPPAFVPPTLPAPALAPALPPLPPTVTVPTLAQPPVLKPVTVAPPAVPPLPTPVASLPPIPKPEVLPPAALVPSVEPAAPVVPAARETAAPPEAQPEPLPTGPRPLPTSATVRDEVNWNRAAEPAPPQPGTWVPANRPAPLPTRAPSDPTWNPGAGAAPPVARGQVNETRADPIADLLKQLCSGRADGLEVRYVGTKKLVVCFEVRGKASAEKLVADISARPELTAYQIDFCVVVK